MPDANGRPSRATTPPPPPLADGERVVPIDFTEIEAEMLRDAEAGALGPDEEAAAALDAEEAARDGGDREPEPDGLARSHHYLLAWRYGEHAVVDRVVLRENLPAFYKPPSAAQELYEQARRRQNMWRARSELEPDRARLNAQMERELGPMAAEDELEADAEEEEGGEGGSLW